MTFYFLDIDLSVASVKNVSRSKVITGRIERLRELKSTSIFYLLPYGRQVSMELVICRIKGYHINIACIEGRRKIESVRYHFPYLSRINWRFRIRFSGSKFRTKIL